MITTTLAMYAMAKLIPTLTLIKPSMKIPEWYKLNAKSNIHVFAWLQTKSLQSQFFAYDLSISTVGYKLHQTDNTV